MILPNLFVLSTRRMEAAHRSPGTTPCLTDERFSGRSGCTGEARGLPSEPVGEQGFRLSGLRYPEKKEWGGREGREYQPMQVCSIFPVPWHLGHFLLFVE